MNYDLDMPPYIQDMADWLDDRHKVHPCNGESAFQGFEIMMAACRSAVARGKVTLPLGPGEPELEALKTRAAISVLPPGPPVSRPDLFMNSRFSNSSPATT